MHGVVGVDLLQSHQEALYQVLSVLELNELEGHLAADADNDGVGQQARVLHLLNAYYLEQRCHTECIKKGVGQVFDHTLTQYPKAESKTYHHRKSSGQRPGSGLGSNTHQRHKRAAAQGSVHRVSGYANRFT